MVKPPPVLMDARVLEYAVLDETVTYSGHSSLFIDGAELGPVPCLAICQGLDEPDSFLLHCHSNWDVLGIASYSSPQESKRRAERIYPGVSHCWVDAGVSEQEALAYREEVSSALQCGFCGKGPDQARQVIEKNGSRICSDCIEEIYNALQESKHQP